MVLFNDILSSSNGRMMNEKLFGKSVDGSVCGLFQGTLSISMEGRKKATITFSQDSCYSLQSFQPRNSQMQARNFTTWFKFLSRMIS
jgi:hypothetical protein